MKKTHLDDSQRAVRSRDVKREVLLAVDAAYEKTYAADQAAQARKPEFLKHVDAHVEERLRKLFT